MQRAAGVSPLERLKVTAVHPTAMRSLAHAITKGILRVPKHHLLYPTCGSGLFSLALVLALATAPAPARAIDISASLGISTTASQDATPVAFVDLAGSTRDGRMFRWQPTASFGFVRGRDVRADLDRNVVIGGVGLRLVDWWKKAFFGAEVGYAADTTASVSSHAQFISSLGWQGEHCVVMLRHISNADLAGGKNLGETMLLLGYTF